MLLPQTSPRFPSKGQIALLITLTIEAVFFATVLVAYIALRDRIEWNVAHTLTRLQIPIANTSILIASALAVWLSVRSIRHENQTGLHRGLLAAVLLGLLFVVGQLYEFSHAGFHADDPSIGGIFFTLLTFHAMHVLAGVVFLILNLIRTTLNDFTASRHEAVANGAWFWYFVTAVWIILFVALYLV